jgi:transposase
MTEAILGIDIAKHTFQVTLLHAGKHFRRRFSNSPAQFEQLTIWLKQHGVPQVHVCLEATGRYGEDLAEYLFAQQHTVSVVNPAQIRKYAESKLTRHKTDPLDADLIADFCQSQHPRPWTPPAPEIRHLQELVHQYEALQAARQQEANRLQAGLRSQAVQQLIHAHLQFLDQPLESLKRLIEEHIRQYPDLQRRQDLLTSIPGIGDLTAAKLQAAQIERFEDTRALTAFAGLNPMQRTSGTSLRRKPRLSKMGDSDLRRDLYFPAIVAKRWNPIVSNFCERLAAKGKASFIVIGAAMRKLLCLAFGVLKSGKPFDPNYAHQG